MVQGVQQLSYRAETGRIPRPLEGADPARLVQLRDEAAARAEEARARRDTLKWRECEQIRRNLNYLVARRAREEMTGSALFERLRVVEQPEVNERLLHAVKHGLYREARLAVCPLECLERRKPAPLRRLRSTRKRFPFPQPLDVLNRMV